MGVGERISGIEEVVRSDDDADKNAVVSRRGGEGGTLMGVKT